MRKKIQFNNICAKDINTSSPNKSSKIALKNVQDRYIIAETDKASGNVALICKKTYATTLCKKVEISKF